jgi:hypothetical protein
MREEERTFRMGTTMVDTVRSLPVSVMKKGGVYYSLTMLKYATGRNANVIKTLLDLRNVNRPGVEDDAEQAEDTDLEEEEVENSELDFVVGESSASDSGVLSIELGARAAGLLGEVGRTSGSELVAAPTIARVGLADLCAVDRPVPEFAKLLLRASVSTGLAVGDVMERAVYQSGQLGGDAYPFTYLPLQVCADVHFRHFLWCETILGRKVGSKGKRQFPQQRNLPHPEN